MKTLRNAQSPAPRMSQSGLRRLFLQSGAAIAVGVATAVMAPLTDARADDFPTPSIYPISWELQFTHDLPKRIVVEIPGRAVPVAYWYLTYGITNNSGQEQTFLPQIEMLTNDGRVIRSDKNIPLKVFESIKLRERNKKFLEAWPKIAGEIRLGDDQARDSLAIWEEPTPRMGTFSIFVTGLSGETANLKDDKGNPIKDDKGNTVFLRKTLQLNYHIRGDEVQPGEDEVNPVAEKWIMR